MLIDTCAIARGEILRAQIAQQTAEWVAAGKEIKQIPCGVGTEVQLDADAKHRARGNAASRRSPARKPSHKKHSGEDLAAFARRMLEGGFV